MTKGSERVQRHRKKVKQLLVEALGGKCFYCGYSKCMRALEFHHKDPTTKTFGISQQGLTYSYKRMLKEANKCILICSNCHAELHEGLMGNSSVEERRPVKANVAGSNPASPV